jgi:uroporphyrinogen-III synthase
VTRKARQPIRVWITRAEPEASATGERVRALGFEPVVAPVLEVQPVGRAPDLTGVGALAFTSRNAVRAFAAQSPERSLPVFAVGDATARAATDSGFTEVSSAGGDVAALASLIAGRKEALNGEVLYLAPEEPAGDLVAMLAGDSVRARTCVVYRTQPREFEPAPSAEAVLVHSAKAARILAGSRDLEVIAPIMAAICISPAALEPIQDSSFSGHIVAPAPNEEAMLQTLDAWAARKAPIRLFPPAFWIAIAFGLACIIGAILVASLGPRLFPPAAKHPAAPTAQPLQFRGKSG